MIWMVVIAHRERLKSRDFASYLQSHQAVTNCGRDFVEWNARYDHAN